MYLQRFVDLNIIMTMPFYLQYFITEFRTKRGLFSMVYSGRKVVWRSIKLLEKDFILVLNSSKNKEGAVGFILPVVVSWRGFNYWYRVGEKVFRPLSIHLIISTFKLGTWKSILKFTAHSLLPVQGEVQEAAPN